MKKSQMAIEFVVLIGMGILISTLVIVVIFQMNTDRNQEKIELKMKDFGYSLQNEIILASEMNEGYMRNFTLPEKVEYTDYNISIYVGRSLMVDYANRRLYYRIPQTNGTIMKGNNQLYNFQGVVYIRQ
jgi:hypothetical protein